MVASDFWLRYRAELPPVCAFLARIGVSAGEIEDLAHDAFLVAFQRLPAYDPRRPIRPWLMGIAYQLSRRRTFRERREQTGHRVSPVDEATPVDEQVAQAHGRAWLRRELANLDEDQRAVFAMHDLEEQPMPEIAEALGIPLNTAYSRLRLARQKLNAALQAKRAQEA